MLKRCISCGRNTKDFAEFPCPDCAEKVVRCHYCRENRNKYSCACGFAGP
ncbi:MAG: RNA-binding protein [Candidatus ainarchaeum sp.]|nr:RNA-binding protein [Candidatus ainarchaeum sp.]